MADKPTIPASNQPVQVAIPPATLKKKPFYQQPKFILLVLGLAIAGFVWYYFSGTSSTPSPLPSQPPVDLTSDVLPSAPPASLIEDSFDIGGEY